MRLEDVLDQIYGNGLYQIILTVLGSINACVNMYDIQANVFMVYKPTKIVCNITADVEWIQRGNYSNFSSNQIFTNISAVSLDEQCYGIHKNDNASLFKCNFWNYSKDVMTGNILTEHNLICEKSIINQWLNVNYFLSVCLGYLLAVSADILGRKPFYLVMLALLIISKIAIVIVGNVWLLFVVLFIRGCAMSANYVNMSQIIELLPPKKRSLYSALHWTGWSIGYVLCSSFAYFFRNWRSIEYVSILMLAGHPVLFCLFPESPRWLLVRGRQKEAIKIFKRIIRVNRVKLSPEYVKQIEENVALICQENPMEKKKDPVKEGFFNGLMDIHICSQLAILALSRIAIHSSYFGLITAEGFLTENFYLNIFLQGVAELPAAFMSWKLTETFGRRKSTVMMMLISGVCIICTWLFDFILPLKVMIGMLAKVCLCCVCFISNMYTVEVLPTTLRNSGLCFCTMLSTLICAFTPLLNIYLPHYLIIIIYGIPLLISALLLGLFIPETKGYPLPDTIADSQGFVRGNEANWALRRQMKLDINREIPLDI